MEDFFVKRYVAGRGFVAYEDQNGNLIKFENGMKTTLSSFATFWNVKDDVIMWSENGILKMESKGKSWQVCNFMPKGYKMKNDVLVFTNAAGGVSMSKDGKVELLSNQLEVSYEIYGSSVLLRLFNNSFEVVQNGKKFQM